MISKEKLTKPTCVVVFFIILCTSGCASMAQKKELSAFNDLYSSGHYMEAAKKEIEEKGDEKADPSTLLQTLQAATALRYARQYEQSSSLFDECEDIIKYHDEQMLASDAASYIGAVLINDAVLDYRGREYDGVMVNTYKALNFWQEGKKDLARVEFNRALDRQRRAKERFAVEMAKLKEGLAKKQEEENKKAKDKNIHELDIKKNIENPEIDKILRERYSNLYEFKAYPDFINPFTTYIAGLFFMFEGDYSKSSNLLKEAYGMVDKNPTVKDDFATVEGISGKQKKDTKSTWIIFENGLGPEKEEFRIDLPILLFTDKVKYTGIALPRLVLRDRAYSHLTIKTSANRSVQTTPLCSMDRVVQTEFKKRYPATVARAITSTLIKTFGQYLAQKELGTLGGFAAGLYQLATTSADIRIWTALPKEFQIAKITAPDNGIIMVETPAGNHLNVNVPRKKNSLVYIKIPTGNAEIVYDVISI